MRALTFFRKDTGTQDSDRDHGGWGHRWRTESVKAMRRNIGGKFAGPIHPQASLRLVPRFGIDESSFPGQLSGEGFE